MPSNNSNRLLIGGVMALLMSGLAVESSSMAADRPVARGTMVADEPVKIGPAYAIDGVTYTPQEIVNYDEVGYASAYPDSAQGTTTANGEAFVASAITAAHKTLPMPSYVEVTALDTGRTILARINDRGPMANDRIIDLSPGAVAQLGATGNAAFPVRVRLVNPPEQERAALRAHGQAAERLEAPVALLTALRQKAGKPPVARAMVPPVAAKPSQNVPPKRARDPDVRQSAPAAAAGDKFVVERAGVAAKPAPSPHASSPRPPIAPPAMSSSGNFVVQVAAFSTRARAEAVAKGVGGRVVEGGGVWRVRLGPYPTQDAAKAGVRTAATKGFENARIMANDAR